MLTDRMPSGGVLVPTASLPGGKLAIANPEREKVRRFAGDRAASRVSAEIIGSHVHPIDPAWTLVPMGVPAILGIEDLSVLRSHAAAGPMSRTLLLPRLLPPSIRFTGELRPYQEEAVVACQQQRCGLIVAPPGAGKTVLALALAHRLGLRPLVLVHTTDLMHQWVEASQRFLGQPLDRIGGGKATIGSDVGTCAMIQTLDRWGREGLEELAARHGVLLIDECHHLPAAQAFRVAWSLGTPRRYGVTATPKRADGLTPMLHWSCGPILHTVTPDDLMGAGVAVQPLVIRVDTGFAFELRRMVQASIGRDFARWGKALWDCDGEDPQALAIRVSDLCVRGARVTVRMLSEQTAEALCDDLRTDGCDVESRVDPKSLAECYAAMCEDEDRIDTIRAAVVALLATGRKVLVLAGRVAHCQRISDALAVATVQSVVLTAKLSDGKRKAGLAAFRSGEVQVCVATTLADEGLDVPDMSGMVMAFPGRSEARTIQRAGRSMRAVVGKARPVIVDLVDVEIGVFANQWHARRRAYKHAECELDRKVRVGAVLSKMADPVLDLNRQSGPRVQEFLPGMGVNT